MTTINGSSYPPGFMVLHGNRLEDLRDLLTQFLKSQPLPPLVSEVILVQSNGMKQWLEIALADDAAMGICAATRLELPSSYLWQIYRQVLGSDAVPQHMPFDKASLVWRLVRLLPILASANLVYVPLQRYLGDGTDGRKLYQLAIQVADVLDGYQSYRADWLNDWAAGQDVLRNHNGLANELDANHTWQAQLWRDIRDDLGDASAECSRASVHGRFMAALKAQVAESKATGIRPSGLPPRIVVFGISSLSMQTIEALAELGQVCQVLMLVQNPCQYYWGDIVEGHDRLRQQVRRRQQAKPSGAGSALPSQQHTVTQPLLASWGKQGRDYLHLLDDFDCVDSYKQRMMRVDAFVDPVEGQIHPSQLAQLQSSILNLEPPPDLTVALRDDDDSITLITTHSAQRELEVLHDRLLAWFDADTQLQPRDVMVMVPDMEVFVPHIQAVFGRFASGQTRHIPFSLADTTARQSPLVQALSQLLMLPTSRISLADWLSLFEVDAVRKRFGLMQVDVDQIQVWLTMAGVRWGLNAQHRQAWGLPAHVHGLDQNTWPFGLRRLLLGYAVGDDVPWGGTLPQTGIKGLDSSLVSKLLDWVEAVSLTLQELSDDKTPSQWTDTMGSMVERFFEANDESQERLIQRLLEPLEAWQKSCDEAKLDTPLPLQVVSDHWLSQIQETGLHLRFFGGGVQFGTLMPMRSIPFKVICLLGMNDGDYPRQTAPRDFDLMAQSWRAGDRSRREDDRYLFLEAILSARQKLYISWQGHQSTDNSEQPPSVLVAQLIEFLKVGWNRPRKPQQQPLQPFSEVYFLEGSAFSTYDKDWARVHEVRGAVDTASTTTQVAHSVPGVSTMPQQLTLDELRKLVRQPVEVFFRTRMGVKLDDVEEIAPAEEPFSLNGLEKYQVGQELLEAADINLALSNLKMSGKLPMAAFGAREVVEFQEKVTVVLDRRVIWQQQYPHAVPAQSIALTVDGVTITGTLTGLLSQLQDVDGNPAWLQLNQRLGAVSEGKDEDLTARVHIVAGLWVNHLAACASGMSLVSVQLGLDDQVVFNSMDKEEALAILQCLLTAYRAAWEKPLPVACKTAWAYLQAESKADRLAADKPDKEPKDPHEVAQLVFEGDFYKGELTESAYLTRAFENYENIEKELPHWAQLVYGDMARHVRVGHQE
jgi:exodeoxyribonuclease V gamma subunit